MQVTTIGIDLAKNVFQLHAVDSKGRAVLRKRQRRVSRCSGRARCVGIRPASFSALSLRLPACL